MLRVVQDLDLDRAEKLPIYADERVAHGWFVDPIVRTLEVLRLDGETYRVMQIWRDDAVVRAEPFEAIEVQVGTLWST